MKWTWTERLALTVMRFIPRIAADAPERVLINVACVLIGLSGLITHPDGSALLTRWPPWFALEWSVAMMCGGLATLAGVGLRHWSLERLGVALIGVCSLVCGFSLVTLFWPRGFVTGMIFLGIAVAKLVRFVMSSAARAHLTHPPLPPPDDDGGDDR